MPRNPSSSRGLTCWDRTPPTRSDVPACLCLQPPHRHHQGSCGTVSPWTSVYLQHPMHAYGGPNPMPLAAASYVPSWPLLCQLRPGVGCLHLGFCASSEDFAVELLSVRAGLETQRKRISQESSVFALGGAGECDTMSMMSRQGRILLCVFAVLLQWQLWSVASATILAPPKGYSVGFTGTTVDGSQGYECTDGAWIKRGSTAEVKAPDGSNLGTYWSVYNKETQTIDYYWSIINSDGTRFESGQPFSGLQASEVKSVKVSTSCVSEFMAIVKIHRYAGDASQVAFVSLTGTKGGLPPREELCTSSMATADVPFEGNFTFYNQDRQPPANLPASLTPNANFVQVVFLEGKVMYKFTKAGQWLYRGIFATIRDVAGGTVLGKFGTVKKPDAFGSKLVFQFKEPNGFTLSGQKVSRPIQLSADGFAWQLLKITSSSGTVSPVGKFAYVLVGGTMGGLAPKIAGRTYGMTWGSPFTSQCYLYTA